jgi:hypothetical protein
MSITSWLRARAVVVLAAATLLAAGGAVAAVGAGLVALATGMDLLVVAGGTLAGVALFGAVAVALFVTLAWTVVGRTLDRLGAAVGTGRRRLADAAAGVEARSPPAARLDVASRLAPPDYDPVLASLRDAYVDGSLSEVGFERELDRLLEAGRIDPADARSLRDDAAFDRDLAAELDAERARDVDADDRLHDPDSDLD